jgi:hypothetical protein
MKNVQFNTASKQTKENQAPDKPEGSERNKRLTDSARELSLLRIEKAALTIMEGYERMQAQIKDMKRIIRATDEELMEIILQEQADNEQVTEVKNR